METKTLVWDTGTGRPPKVGQVIESCASGKRYKVVARKGNKITLERIEKNGLE